MFDHFRTRAARHPYLAVQYVVPRPQRDITLQRAHARTAPNALIDEGPAATGPHPRRQERGHPHRRRGGTGPGGVASIKVDSLHTTPPGKGYHLAEPGEVSEG